MKRNYTLVIALLLVFATVGWAGTKQWGFNASNGRGGVNKPDVDHALGRNVTMGEAHGLVFTAVDTVEGCTRERRLRTLVRTGGNGEHVTGYWFFGFESEDSLCGPPGLAGSDARLHVDGIPIQ